MPDTVFQPSTITLALKGLMVLFTKRQTECRIGLLRRVPHWHNRKLTIFKLPGGSVELVLADEDFAGDFTIEVSDTSITGIRQRYGSEQINRILGPQPQPQDPQRQTFNWLLDFERELIPPLSPPIGAARCQFAAFVTLNNGEIFTTRISDNHLRSRRLGSGWNHVGRVAVEMGIQITLDRPESKAVFKKNGQELKTFRPGANYQINIERTDTSSPPAIGRDADYYFTAVGSDLLPDELLVFDSIPPPPVSTSPPSTPDATCPVIQLSQSDPT